MTLETRLRFLEFFKVARWGFSAPILLKFINIYCPPVLFSREQQLLKMHLKQEEMLAIVFQRCETWRQYP